MGETVAALTVINAITMPVIALTQIAKWCGLPKRWAPLAVLFFAGLVCAVWAFAEGPRDWWAMLFQYLVATLTVTVSALGLYSFVTDQVTRLTVPSGNPPPTATVAVAPPRPDQVNS